MSKSDCGHPMGNVTRPTPAAKVTDGNHHPTGKVTHRHPPAAKVTGGSNHPTGRVTRRG